jgi:hypothetical protein
MKKSKLGYKRNSPDKREKSLKIDSNLITMEGVDFPVEAYPNGDNPVLMQPGLNYYFPNSTEVIEIPMRKLKKQTGGPVKPLTRYSSINDLLVTPEEISENYEVYKKRFESCTDGPCLERANKYYNEYIAKPLGFPDSWQQNTLAGISSGKKHKRFNEYGESADSWDIHGLLRESGGKGLYSAKPIDLKTAKKLVETEGTSPYEFSNMSIEDRKRKLKEMNIPIGTIVGFGFGGSEKDKANTSYNSKKGLVDSRHSARVVGYDNEGNPMVFDQNGIVPLYNPTFLSGDFPITNITVPKGLEKYTYSTLKSSSKLEDIYEPTKVSYKGNAPVDTDEFDPFLNSLKANKKLLSDNLNITFKEYDELQKQAAALAIEETEGGNDLITRGVVPTYITDKLGLGKTRGITQINKDILFNNQNISNTLKSVGITRENYNPWNPDHQAIATVILLKSNEYIANKNAKIEGNKQDLTPIEKAIYQWNKPSLLKKGEAQGDLTPVRKAKKAYEDMSLEYSPTMVKLYNIEFDSNKARWVDGTLVVKDIHTGKDYGVVRNQDGSYDFKREINKKLQKGGTVKPNIQKLGDIEFDSNTARQSDGYLIVKDNKTGKDFGVVRNSDGSYRHAGMGIKDFFDKHGNRVSEEYKSSLAGSLFMAPVDYLTSLPQAVSTYVSSGGKEVLPSRAVKIQNPIGAAVTDAILDPLNLVGVGELKAAISPLITAGKYIPVTASAAKGADVFDDLYNAQLAPVVGNVLDLSGSTTSTKGTTNRQKKSVAKTKALGKTLGLYDDAQTMVIGANEWFDFFESPEVPKTNRDGGIHIDPSKRGTFKAQATRMGMSVKEAADHILANKDKYTPKMIKKANFAKNFAQDGMLVPNIPESTAMVLPVRDISVDDMLELSLNGKTKQERAMIEDLSSRTRVNKMFEEAGDWQPKKKMSKPKKFYEKEEGGYYEEGGPTNGQTRRSTRKGKKIDVYMDGSWHAFGDSSMQDFRQHKSEKRKEAFYARHKKNLQGDSPRAKAFRVYAKKTWEEGGEIPVVPELYNGVIEVENNETVHLPNGTLAQFKGKDHEEGGIPTNLPGGSFIFSEHLKAPKELKEALGIKSKKKLSYADLSKKYPTKGLMEFLDESTDEFRRATKEIELGRNLANLNLIAETQEAMKTKFKNGGKYQDGGPRGIMRPDGSIEYLDDSFPTVYETESPLYNASIVNRFDPAFGQQMLKGIKSNPLLNLGKKKYSPLDYLTDDTKDSIPASQQKEFFKPSRFKGIDRTGLVESQDYREPGFSIEPREDIPIGFDNQLTRDYLYNGQRYDSEFSKQSPWIDGVKSKFNTAFDKTKEGVKTVAGKLKNVGIDSTLAGTIADIALVAANKLKVEGPTLYDTTKKPIFSQYKRIEPKESQKALSLAINSLNNSNLPEQVKQSKIADLTSKFLDVQGQVDSQEAQRYQQFQDQNLSKLQSYMDINVDERYKNLDQYTREKGNILRQENKFKTWKNQQINNSIRNYFDYVDMTNKSNQLFDRNYTVNPITGKVKFKEKPQSELSSLSEQFKTQFAGNTMDLGNGLRGTVIQDPTTGQTQMFQFVQQTDGSYKLEPLFKQ